MVEDITDYNPKIQTYKEQSALRLPSMISNDPVSASVSPRFDSILNRSNVTAWSPLPLDQPSSNRNADHQSNIQKYSKSPEIWQGNSFHGKSPEDYWSPSQIQTKSIDVWPRSNNQTKPSEPNFQNSSMNRSDEVKFNKSQTSSEIKMLDSTNDKSSGSTTSTCSPRCKLGMLGFVIGLLAVCIPLAVILVLWLRQ